MKGVSSWIAIAFFFTQLFGLSSEENLMTLTKANHQGINSLENRPRRTRDLLVHGSVIPAQVDVSSFAATYNQRLDIMGEECDRNYQHFNETKQAFEDKVQAFQENEKRLKQRLEEKTRVIDQLQRNLSQKIDEIGQLQASLKDCRRESKSCGGGNDTDISINIGVPTTETSMEVPEVPSPSPLTDTGKDTDTDSDWKEIGSSRFKVFKDPVDWATAKSKCASEKHQVDLPALSFSKTFYGHLAYDNSDEIHAFLTKEFQRFDLFQATEDIWLGSTDANSQGTWKWLDETLADSDHWSHNYDDYGENGPANSWSDCMAFSTVIDMYTYKHMGIWRDQSCGKKQLYACQIDLVWAYDG